MTVITRQEVTLRIYPPTVGIVTQAGVLMVLAVTVGLGVVGWGVGAAFALVTWIMLARALGRPEGHRWGPADSVTLARLTMAGGVTALVADSLGRPGPVPVLTGLAAVALLLDGVDGQVARRTGTTSRLGARFDMEADSALVLVLSVFVADTLGWWVLAIGAYRYIFVAMSWAAPWLRASLPPRLSRKVAAAMQGVVLAVASTDLIPKSSAAVCVGLSLVFLTWSFGTDVRWLWKQQASALHREPAEHTRAAHRCEMASVG